MIAWAVALATAAAAPAAPAIDVQTAARIEQAIERGRLVQAHEMIGLSIRSQADLQSPPFLKLVGQLALAEGDDATALASFQKLLLANPDDCVATEGFGIASLKSGKADAARAALEKALNLCPPRWQAFNALGVLADQRGDWVASEAAYRKALELVPDSARVLNNLGYSLLLQRRFSEAEAVLLRAKMESPRDERVLNNLDLAKAGQGKPIVARTDDEAYRLNNAGYVAYLEGRYDDARTYFVEAMKASPTHFGRAASNLEMLDKTVRQ